MRRIVQRDCRPGRLSRRRDGACGRARLPEWRHRPFRRRARRGHRAACCRSIGRIGKLIADRLDCQVVVQTGTNYTAVIEAMRAHRVEMANFGAFSYVLAHQVAGAEAVATFAAADGNAGQLFRHHHHLARLRHHDAAGQVKGKAFAFSDPGIHLRPPDPGLWRWSRPASIRTRTSSPFYSGSHTASFEALRNHKVPVGELNSTAIAGAELAGFYKPDDYVTLWKSAADPERSFRGARRSAAGVQGAPHAGPAHAGPQQHAGERHEVPWTQLQPRARAGGRPQL